MAKTSKGIFSNKLDFIDESSINLGKSYAAAEQWLLNRILRDVLPELDVVDGKLKNTNSNINIVTSKLNKVFNTLRTGRNKDIVKQVLKDMDGIRKSNNQYFNLVGDLVGEKFDNAAGRVETIMQKSLGFNPDGTLKANSFIDSISSNDAINKNLREIAIRQIQGGNTIKDFTAELEQSIVTDKDGLGVLNKFYKQTIDDRYVQYDRAEAKSFADELRMQAFIFSGGKVTETRRFCCQRNGLVFTRDEAQHWSSLKWDGKNKGYVPLIDMGGYNCRHSPQWISNRVALRRRPDLMVDDNGMLVLKPGASKQKLRHCA